MRSAKRARPRKLDTMKARYEKRGRRFSMTLTHAQIDAFDGLLHTGLFGFTRTDVVRRLLDEKLRELTVAGWLRFVRTGDGHVTLRGRLP